MAVVIAGAYSSPYATGFLIEASSSQGGAVIAETIQCVHCGRHWLVERGSGKIRGFCMDCGGPHCGAPKCWHPVPHLSYRKKLDLHNDNPQKYPDL